MPTTKLTAASGHVMAEMCSLRSKCPVAILKISDSATHRRGEAPAARPRSHKGAGPELRLIYLQIVDPLLLK